MAAVLDEYCRYYADFSKILGIYIRNVYPQLDFELEQLLDASYNVWHRLNDEEKISLAAFLEEMSRDGARVNSELLTTTTKRPVRRRCSVTPFQLYLNDERKTFLKRRTSMSMREINQRLSKRWQTMPFRTKAKYERRSYLAKKRLQKREGE